MKEIDPGHVYELAHLDGDGFQRLDFVNRNPGCEKEGTTSQEVLRILISRTKFLDSQIRWELNDQIIYHYRMAIALHEARVIIRKTEKGQMMPEQLPVDYDGHFIIEGSKK